MKEVKKFLLGFLSLVSINLISAYSGNYYGFNIGDLFLGIKEYIIPTLIFLGLFYAFTLVFRKLKMKNAWVIGLLTSCMVMYGLAQLNVDFTGIFYKIGFAEDFLFSIAPWIVLGFAVLTLWTGNFGKVLILFGAALTIIGIAGIPSESGAAILTGFCLIIIGLWINKKERMRKLYRRSDLKDKIMYKDYRRGKRDRSLQRWNKAGKGIGKGIAWTGSKIKKINRGAADIGGFNYRSGMRRGGTKSTRSRFVSKASTQRYARRYGSGAARRRFKAK